MKPEITIIDNFYEDIDWLQPYLNSVSSRKNDHVNYAGQVYPAPPDQTSFALEKIDSLFSLKDSLSKHQGEIRVTHANDQQDFKSFIHADDSFNVLIYLSGEETEASGTRFYRHKDLNISSVPNDLITQNKISSFFDVDTNNLERWEVIETVPFKKNRAIFFDGRFFHSVPPTFYGHDLKTARITQNFFFGRPK